MPLFEQVSVKDSPLHGKGIFSNQFIPSDTLILVIKGEEIDGTECERRENEEDNVYIFWNGDDSYIDTNNSDKIKFINHDCKPNCYVDNDEEDNLCLYALRDINKDEELTIDYGYDEIYENCNCSSCSNQ
ncbi:MAG: SET domain-containing protein [Ignavibacteriaceae bacterium]|jgi:SET domain-containing protein|nr:SET domain-containing protein [Ignavibacteriaceae bacterium]